MDDASILSLFFFKTFPFRNRRTQGPLEILQKLPGFRHIPKVTVVKLIDQFVERACRAVELLACCGPHLVRSVIPQLGANHHHAF